MYVGQFHENVTFVEMLMFSTNLIFSILLGCFLCCYYELSWNFITISFEHEFYFCSKAVNSKKKWNDFKNLEMSRIFLCCSNKMLSIVLWRTKDGCLFRIHFRSGSTITLINALCYLFGWPTWGRKSSGHEGQTLQYQDVCVPILVALNKRASIT